MIAGKLSGCIEIDLRQRIPNQAREVQKSLDGLEPGDVVKLIVNQYSDPLALAYVDLSKAQVQVSADSVYTQKRWFDLFSE